MMILPPHLLSSSFAPSRRAFLDMLPPAILRLLALSGRETGCPACIPKLSKKSKGSPARALGTSLSASCEPARTPADFLKIRPGMNLLSCQYCVRRAHFRAGAATSACVGVDNAYVTLFGNSFYWAFRLAGSAVYALCSFY